MMTKQCKRCGVATSGPQDLCARCLFEVGLAEDPAASGTRSSVRGRPLAPEPAELAPLFPELEIVRLVIPNPGATTTVNQTATANATLHIGRALSDLEKFLFTVSDFNGNGDQLIPRAPGVDLDYEDTVGAF